MRLIADEINGVYVWVDAAEIELSPHFDYEADAIRWLEDFEADQMSKHFG